MKADLLGPLLVALSGLNGMLPVSTAGAAGSGPLTLASKQGPSPGIPPAGKIPDKPKTEKDQQARPADPLPTGALRRLGSARLRPGGDISSLAFLAGGRVLASTGHKGIHFWDAATGQEVRRIEAPGDGPRKGIRNFALSPDGKLLAAACYDNTARLWDAATGREIRIIRAGSAVLAFSRDGRKLVSGDWHGTLRFWDLATGKEDLRILSQQSSLSTIAFTADDRALVSWDYNHGVFYWEVASGKQLREFVLPDENLRRFLSPAGGITSLTHSADGKLLAVGCLNNTIHVCDQATGRELRRFEARGHQVRVFSPDGKILVSSGERGITLWDVAAGKEVGRLPLGGFPVAFSPDGKTLAVGQGWAGTIRLWDVATGRELVPRPGHDGPVSRLAFAPDGRLLASRCFEDRTVRLWDVATGQELHRLAAQEGYPLAYAPDGRTLVSGGWDGAVVFWQPATGKELRQLLVDTEAKYVNAVGFSADGGTLVTSSTKIGSQTQRSGFLAVWDVATGKALVKHPKVMPVGSDVVFSPDGKSLAYEGNGIVLWDVARNRERLTLQLPDGYRFIRLAYSPDGKTLAAVTFRNVERGPSSSWENFTLRVWELATGKEVFQVPTKDYLVDALAFSPDGRVVAWGCAEAVRLFEVATGRERQLLQGHGARVQDFAFAPDGKTLATGLADSTILIWDLGRAARREGVVTEIGFKDLDQLWNNLAGEDAAKAHRAIWTLVAAPEKAIALLKERLRPAPEENQKRIRQLISDLDSAEFAVRNEASRQLELLGAEAVPALLKALEENPSAEVRKRIEAALDQPQTVRSPETLRSLRAIQVLEQVGSEEARQALQALARRVPLALQTQEARAALARLERRKKSP